MALLADASPPSSSELLALAVPVGEDIVTLSTIPRIPYQKIRNVLSYSKGQNKVYVPFLYYGHSTV